MTLVFDPSYRKSTLSPDVSLPATRCILKFTDPPRCIIQLHEKPYFAQSFVANFAACLPVPAGILHSEGHQFFWKSLREAIRIEGIKFFLSLSFSAD